MTTSSTNFVFFPEEIIENILLRLPVKIACVSKTWNLLITNPRFVRSLEISRHNPEIMISPLHYSDQFEYTLSCKYPLQVRACNAKLWGSCDGLLCVGLKDSYTVVLWNPTTTEYKKLPPSISVDGIPIYEYDISYGFGYNPTLIDYQVVKIIRFGYGRETRSVIQIYSLGKNSWRRIQDIPYTFKSLSGYVVDGKLHWLAVHCSEVKKYYCILAYDFSAEIFQEVPLPVTVDAFNGFMYISSFDGKLFLNVPFELGGTEGWVMNNYGLLESWTRLFKTTKRFFRPLFSTKEGEIVIRTALSRIVLCDPSDTGLNNTTELVTSKQLFEEKAYTHSLVSLGVGSEMVKDTDSWAWCSMK